MGNRGDDKPWENHGIQWGSKFWDNPETWLTKIKWGKLGNSEPCQHFPTFGAHHQLTGMVEPSLCMTDWKAWGFWFHGILFCVYSTHSTHSTHSTRIRNSQAMGIRWFLDTRTRSSVRGLAAHQTCSVASSPQCLWFKICPVRFRVPIYPRYTKIYQYPNQEISPELTMNIFDQGETSFSTGQYGISTSMYGKTQTIQPPLVYWWINPYFDASAP